MFCQIDNRMRVIVIIIIIIMIFLKKKKKKKNKKTKKQNFTLECQATVAIPSEVCFWVEGVF
jgi:preprotein translocase subunit YajC